MENNNIITIYFTCPMCGKEHSLEISEELLDRVENRRENGEYIQDILVGYSRFDREKFITGYCDECQKEIFNLKEER
jgi:hypothetical protein